MKLVIIRKTDFGHTFFQVSRETTAACGWGNVCDFGNEDIGNMVYVVPVLGHRALCADCFSEWEDRAEFHEEDVPYEKEMELELLSLFASAGADFIIVEKTDGDKSESVVGDEAAR